MKKDFTQSHGITSCLHEEPCGCFIARESIAVLKDKILCGDASAKLSTIPDSSVQCIVTSPPYFRQRDYGMGNYEVGDEDNPDEYIRKLVDVFWDCRRVLKSDGLLWLNLGDKFLYGRLLGMPWRVAIALQQTGWILRCDIIWHKPNAMPHSVKTRPTVDHEYIFMFSKSAEYYYDADAIREPHVTFSENSRMKGGRNHFGKRNGTPEAGKNNGNPNLHNGRWDQAFHPLGRNKRSVWNIPLSKYRGAHFAVFPEKLVENCIMASSRPKDVILDPFAGSGTVGVVAAKFQRSFVLIELNSDYCNLIEKRLYGNQMELVNK
ncbi:MAG: site-specific DNA-methyltransferase [Verrucomicrobiota bacterium]|jgi:site-specific DNA-methyltransferase (adenine-specific)